jgi:hypothetical protein
MEIYQNRKRRLGMLWLNIFLSVFFFAITLFILFILIGSIVIDLAKNSVINRQNFILLIPAILIGFSGLISYSSLLRNWRFLKIREPILTISNKGIKVYHSLQDKIVKSWDELGEIEYRYYMKHYARRKEILVIKDADETPLAYVPVNMLDVEIEEVLIEIDKYKKVKRT